MHHNGGMFFRRKRPHEVTFEERLQQASQAGFQVEKESGSRARIVRDGCAARVSDVPGGLPRLEEAGPVMAGEIGLLVDGGFQKFWRTSSGRKAPAIAGQLKTLHAFQEDLREALGLESLFNEALGTVNDLHLYDRVKDRDQGVPKRPWE